MDQGYQESAHSVDWSLDWCGRLKAKSRYRYFVCSGGEFYLLIHHPALYTQLRNCVFALHS